MEYPFPSITPPYPNKPICNYNTSFYTKIKSTKELQQNINVSDKGVIKDEKKKKYQKGIKPECVHLQRESGDAEAHSETYDEGKW